MVWPDFLRVTPFSFYAVSCFGSCDALRICFIVFRISCSSGKLTNPAAVQYVDLHRFSSALLFRIGCFLWIPFFYPYPCQAASRAYFFRKVIARSYSIRMIIQFSRCIWKGLSLIPTGKHQMETLNRKIFANYRTALHSFGQIEPKGTLSFGHFPTKNSPFGERYFGKRQKIARRLWQAHFRYEKYNWLSKI